MEPSLSPARLAELSEEIAQIAEALARLGFPRPSPVQPIDTQLIRSMQRLRRQRTKYFKAELFGEPAWDMMLELMVARLESRHVTVSSLCMAAAVPTTTALRWLGSLCESGLFIRYADRQDARRTYIRLADSTAASLEAYLHDVRSGADWI
jgi:DNA-binding MarR family transcriptional regulator